MDRRRHRRNDLNPPDLPDSDEPIEVASPVCYAQDIEAQTSPRQFEAGELVAFLNLLLESERAALRVLRNWCLEAGHNADVGAWTLAAMRDDLTSICARLWDHVAARGVEPSSAVGPFYDEALALTAWPDRLRHLDMALCGLVRDVRGALPRIVDQALVELLREALERHENAVSLMTGISRGKV